MLPHTLARVTIKDENYTRKQHEAGKGEPRQRKQAEPVK
jgi:hypothetical protein